MTLQALPGAIGPLPNAPFIPSEPSPAARPDLLPQRLHGRSHVLQDTRNDLGCPTFRGSFDNPFDLLTF